MYQRSRSFFDFYQRSLIFHYFQRSFALKPLDRLRSIYILRQVDQNLSKQVRSHYQDGPQAHIDMVKTFKKSSLETNSQ